ncbi:MAG TPA: glycerophosphodiester phosphodiesterase [Acidimicrobiales bacterium]|nr:glycerophosphodiester phosphodiesterase [Acidimicrobiales bacterium]
MDNVWLGRRVLNYAHQGGAREQPSSTLAAMRAAVATGAHALELDVHPTADGELVVCHDATVDRTTNGTGRITEMTLADVQALDNAYWWRPGEVVDHESGPWPLRGLAPDDPAYRIPSLHEVLDAFPGVYLNLDIKETTGYEATLAAVLREHGRSDDVIVASFHDIATERFSACAPEVGTSAGTMATAAFYFAVRDGSPPPPTSHVALQVPPAHGDTVIVDERFVAAAHEAGLAVHVWTIDEPEEMRRLIALGVDGVMTDRPSVLADVLGAEPIGEATNEHSACLGGPRPPRRPTARGG